MLIRRDAATSVLDPRLLPSIGNGFVATIAGSANTYLAGVFNLNGQYEPFRARLPGLAAMDLLLTDDRGRPAESVASSVSSSVSRHASSSVCTNAPPAGRATCPSPPSGPTPASCAAAGCCFIPAVATYCAVRLNSSCGGDHCKVHAGGPLAPVKGWADIEALDLARAAFLRYLHFLPYLP